MPGKKLIVNVTSDVACPWCWVGKRAIEVAAANLSGEFEVELHWHPFELESGIPPGKPYNLFEYMGKKFNDPHLGERWASNPEQNPLNRSCRASNLPNIEFLYMPQSTRFSTYRAHTLLTYAGPIKGDWAVQNRLKEAMLRMTHKESRNLDDVNQLTTAAQEAGLATTRQEVEAILADGNVKVRLDEELRQSHRLPQFDGVPYFTFANGEHFSGGQPVEVFEAALKEVAAATAAAS